MTKISLPQLCEKFTDSLRMSAHDSLEGFLAACSLPVAPVPDKLLAALLPIEIDHLVESGERIFEKQIAQRFTLDQLSIVTRVFENSRELHAERQHQFIPDPRKTDPNLALDLFCRSTNVLNPRDYVSGQSSLYAEPHQPEVRLRVVKGPHSGKELVFDSQASVLVGRGDDAKLQLPSDTRCSRLHCRFEISPPHCEVIDLKSTNGTLINGKRVARQQLSDKDTVQTFMGKSTGYR